MCAHRRHMVVRCSRRLNDDRVHLNGGLSECWHSRLERRGVLPRIVEKKPEVPATWRRARLRICVGAATLGPCVKPSAWQAKRSVGTAISVRFSAHKRSNTSFSSHSYEKACLKESEDFT